MASRGIEDPVWDDRAVWDVWLSANWMPTVAAADEVRLIEALEDGGPASAEELAERTGLNLHALKGVLPMLTSLAFLKVHLGRYQPTEPARLYLLHDSPFYWGHAFSFARSMPNTQRYVTALKAQPVDNKGRPVEAWESGQLTPEMARPITAFMNSHSMPAAVGVARHGDLDGVTRLLDVGGGSGCFSIALARRHPELRCTVMELPAVCELAKEYVAEAGLSDRIDTVTVDMFRQAWPKGYDAIFMSNIVHDWDLETNAQLFRSSFDALPSGGRIYLHEMLIADDGSGPLASAGYSMLMLAGTKGRQYGAGELQRLLEDAGFADFRVQDTYGHFSLVIATKR